MLAVSTSNLFIGRFAEVSLVFVHNFAIGIKETIL